MHIFNRDSAHGTEGRSRGGLSEWSGFITRVEAQSSRGRPYPRWRRKYARLMAAIGRIDSPPGLRIRTLRAPWKSEGGVESGVWNGESCRYAAMKYEQGEGTRSLCLLTTKRSRGYIGSYRCMAICMDTCNKSRALRYLIIILYYCWRVAKALLLLLLSLLLWTLFRFRVVCIIVGLTLILAIDCQYYHHTHIEFKSKDCLCKAPFLYS